MQVSKRSEFLCSAVIRLALGAGRWGRSEVAWPSLSVLGKGDEPSPGAGGRRGGARVWGGSSGVVGGGYDLWNNGSN